MRSCLLCSLLFLVVASSFSQVTKNAKELATSDSGTPTTVCSYTFNSGTGPNATQFCVTANGNITQFSRPSGVEYLGTMSEGYGGCDVTTDFNPSYVDYAVTDNGGWGPATLLSQTDSSVKISRTTTDGFWTLIQTITQVKASTQGPGSAVISMSLRNNTKGYRVLNFLRYADVNANSTKSNDFDFTRDTAYGLDSSSEHGFASINNTFNSSISYNALTQNVPTGPAPCSYTNNVAPQPFVGDGSVVQFWIVAGGGGSIKTVKMTYKPI